tara:strand:- start:703 stop:1041 length:339 start_codon:yes stop_codon:yes gene_type:complete
MSLDTDKIKVDKKTKPKKTIKEIAGKLFSVGADGVTELISSAGEGMGRLSEKERMMIKSAIDKMGKTENKSGPDLTKRAKGGMVKKYRGGGSVHNNKKQYGTQGYRAARKPK